MTDTPRDTPTPAELEAARHAAARRIGEVSGLRLSDNHLDFTRRLVRRELLERLDTLGRMRRHDDQSPEAFRAAIAQVEAKVGFLQTIVYALERARVL